MKKIKVNKIKKIVDLIKNNNSFFITAHMNLEGDALGSELALYLLLKKLNKKAIIYNNDPTPEIYKFLPSHKSIKNDFKKGKFDIAFVLDCSDSSRAGKIENKLSAAAKVVNIDHHISNTHFGDINWVEAEMSSASEMIYYLVKNLKAMDKDIALCLYTGIFTDSGSFTYANTSFNTHKVIAELMRYDICPDLVYKKVHSLCVPGDIQFIGKCISKLKFCLQEKICWITISQWQEKNYDLTEIIFSIMRLLKNPEVFILFKKINKNKTRINFRSSSHVDVNKIAKFFGGGGHRRASGTTLDQSLKESEKKVIRFIQRRIDGKK
ncbi:MAG: DHH family phosphoesterase [Candidatus Omnitrophica bacterium]|nr:DHH family phosphoesterase [Candidatus Omnitrophota bacterium]MCF7891706.1 DHH family phosphoesterase [Candidatus Omnitrophota bacterium]MCF7895598.1 DHH family phosphoesterase [Candidatus Omnitrophota bacterium]MCF7897882.1 DHH family phosphoesterase [Candidatus Omnitrophota bacterium]MCF7909114.1 DHH family phosphoesterase [Candidatus Omnitrophota bacterium]